MNNRLTTDLQRWSEDVARDPASPSFVPLADAYRRQGRREDSLRLCLRGLEQNPGHVAGHNLVARLYAEDGESDRAFERWTNVLHIEPDNFEAHRGLGFVELERGNAAGARRHLELAANRKPHDRAVQEALAYLATLESTSKTDPSAAFEPLLSEAPFLGALVLDTQGLVLAATFSQGDDSTAEALGAILGGTIEEATRAARLLSLGQWRGILLDAEGATIYLGPLNEDLMVLVAARRGTPTGWVLRTASRATDLARQFVEASV